MKNAIPVVLAVLLILSFFMQYQASEHQKSLVKEIAELKEYNARLEKEMIALKQNLGDDSRLSLKNDFTEPTLDELIEDAGSVFQDSLESMINSVESEFSRAKKQLHQELERLKEQSSNNDINESDSDDKIQSTEKHST